MPTIRTATTRPSTSPAASKGVLILVAALAIIWAALQRLLRAAAAARRLGLGLALSVFAARCSTALLAWAMLRKAREHRSMALEADARHLFTDVWTSAGVVARPAAVRAHRLAVARPGDRASPSR